VRRNLDFDGEAHSFPDMKLSILLRTQNSAQELPRFRECAEREFDIVCVDHASRDGTKEIVRGMGGRLIPWERRDFSYGGALNLGVPFCEQDWILAMSPHARPVQPHFWDRLASDLSGLPDDVLACQVALTYPGSRNPRAGKMRILTVADIPSLPNGLYGNTCCAYRKDALISMPFDESLKSSEDVEWVLRALRNGNNVAIDENICVFYQNRAPLSRYWRKGRTDLPALSAILGVNCHPGRLATLFTMGKDFARLCIGRIPGWWWVRMFVKRLAELTLP
jgi:glycosyltransferase involved in cell wall biosynthesis